MLPPAKTWSTIETQLGIVRVAAAAYAHLPAIRAGDPAALRQPQTCWYNHTQAG
jgi:hypothetical protein